LIPPKEPLANVDKETNRGADWPPDLMGLFFEKETI
jgi:hypothetical protein